MLYTFNSFDSASKTVFTYALNVEVPDPGPYFLAYAVADRLHELSDYQHVYRTVAAWQVLSVTVVILQTEDNRVLTIQLEP